MVLIFRPGKVTCRVADELPWHIYQLENKAKLHECILVLCIFLRLYGRGRFAELIGYWNFVGADKVTMAEEYFEATKRLEESKILFELIRYLFKFIWKCHQQSGD